MIAYFPVYLILHGYEQNKVYILFMVQCNILDFVTVGLGSTFLT